MRAQLAFTLDHFGCEFQIGFAADTFEVIDQNRLSVGWRFRDAYVAWNDGVVDLGAKVNCADVGDNLVREIVACSRCMVRTMP